jgi:hypothetical protein
MQANASYTTTTNSHTLVGNAGALPSDFKEFRGKPFYVEFLGSSRPMDLLWSRQSAIGRWSDQVAVDIGDPHSLVVDETLEVWPLPDGSSDYADGQYRITLPYWRYLPTLVNTSDTNWFTLNTPQYIINWAVWQGFKIDWDEARAQFWQTETEREALRAILTGKKQFLSADDTLVPYQGALEAPHSVR